MKKLPSLQETKHQLGSSRDLFYTSLHKAVLAARETISKGLCPFTPILFANCVRVKFIDLLKVMPDVVVEDVSNDGVIFILKGVRIWCLKAQDGKVPPPGKSDNRLDFSKQRRRILPMQLVLLDEAYTPKPIEALKVDLNLFLVWDYTALRELNFVQIVCPRDATTTEVSIEWIDPIEKPLALDNDSADSQPEMSEHEDLTYTLRDDTTEETFDEGAG